MIPKLKEKEEAIKLRLKGFSLREISLKLNVSKGSVSLWVKGIEMDKKAKERISCIKKNAFERVIATNHRNKLLREKQRNDWAKEIFKKINGFNTFENRLICSLLYWGEGAKFSNCVQFTNSDPIMVKVFVKTLCKGFGTNKSKIRANLHLHKYHNEKKQKTMWCDLLQLSESQFNKTYWKPNSYKIKREGYPGCIRICYHSKEIVDKIKAFYKELSKKMIGP